MFGVKVKGEMIEVAHRRCGEMVWINQLGKALMNCRKVHALDNTAQGVNTIGDIKLAISSGKICL